MSRRPRGSAKLARADSRSPEHRTGNTIFYVVTEGEGTEYDYFSSLNRTYGSGLKFMIKSPPLHVQRNGLSPSLVAEHCCLQSQNGDIDQIWGLFDHDGRPDIDKVCLRAKPDRVNLVLSHPSFELWLLLHLRDFTPGDRQDGDSDHVTNKLRAAHRAFADYRKGSKRIDTPRFAALTGDNGIHNAVRRARYLSRHFGRETPSQRDPSTEVYLLIEALGIVPRLS